MLGKKEKHTTERDFHRMKHAALQTKSEKRWRAKGSHLNALINEYSIPEPEEPEDTL